MWNSQFNGSTMEFHYKVIDQSGERCEGYLQSLSEQRARRELLKRYKSILSLSEVDKKSIAFRQQIRVKTELVVVFFRRLGTMLDSGVQLAESLDFLADSTVEQSLADAVELLAKSVQEGQSLSEAMRHPKLQRVFDTVSIGMVAMGEQTGRLGQVINQIADLKERQLQLTKAFVSALTYPAILFCVILILVVLFSVILGPGDEGLFSAFGTEMPWPTRVVQTFSDTIRNPWIVIVVILTLSSLVAAFKWKMERDSTFRLWIHAFYLKLPIIGQIIKKVEAARLLYFLGDALTVGIPLATALIMATSVCGNERTKLELRKVHQEFCDGEDLAGSLARRDIFPRMAQSMIETGLESGQLDQVLEKISGIFEEDVRLALNSLSQLAEPVMLIFAGGIAGFFAIATLMPLIKMVETL